MGAVLLYTVGNSDLLLDGRPLERGQRGKGQEIDNNFEEYRPRLATPLLDACLQWLERRKVGLDRIYFFGTDQPEGVPEQHRGQDTVYAAQVLVRFAKVHYPNARVKPAGLKCDASSYGEVYRWFEKALPRGKEGDTYYLCPTGGTTAMSVGLLLHGIARSRENCKVLYVSRGASEAEVSDFPIQFLAELKRERVRQAVGVYDFPSACRLIGGDTPWLEHICRYGALRLNADLAGARDSLDKALTTAPAQCKEALRSEMVGLLHELEQPRRKGELAKSGPALVEEFYYELDAAWKQERYQYVLMRLERLGEILARHLVEKYTGLPTDEKQDKNRFIAKVEGLPVLRCFLENYKLKNGVMLKYDRMGVLTFLAIIDYLVAGDAGRHFPPLPGQSVDKLTRVRRVLGRLDSLREWRNDVVHDFKGVSRPDILRTYGVDSETGLFSDLADTLAFIGRKTDRSPYKQVAELVSQALG